MVANTQIAARPAQGDILYRVVRIDQPSSEDFRSHREQAHRRPAPEGTPWLLVVGVSMFDTRDGALQIARRRPAWIAELRLAASRGIHVAGIAGSPHGVGRPRRACGLRAYV